MQLSDEMQRLSRHFLDAYDMRIAGVADICAEVAELRQRANTFVAELDAQHQTMAQAQRQRLQDEKQTLQRDTSAFLTEMDAQHQAMAQAQRQRLQDEKQTLQRDTSAFLTEMDAQHQAMAQAQRQRLHNDYTQLATDVAAMRMQFQTDFNAAHQTWGELRKQMQQRRARKAGPSV